MKKIIFLYHSQPILNHVGYQIQLSTTLYFVNSRNVKKSCFLLKCRFFDRV